MPKIDVLVSGTLRSDKGPSLAANWAAPNSATVGLNRPFAGVAGQTVTVNLIEPNTLFGDRVNEINLRFAKVLRFGGTRSNVGVDLYNAFNAAPVLSYNQTFIADGHERHRQLAAADVSAPVALREDQRANRFLRRRITNDNSQRLRWPNAQLPTNAPSWRWELGKRQTLGVGSCPLSRYPLHS